MWMASEYAVVLRRPIGALQSMLPSIPFADCLTSHYSLPRKTGARRNPELVYASGGYVGAGRHRVCQY